MNTEASALSEALSKSQKVNEEDAKTIQKTFKDESILKSMRVLLLGLDVTDGDKSLVRAIFSDIDVRRIVGKRFLPSLTRESPIGTANDVWMGVESMVFGAPRDTIEQAVKYKELSIEMTRKGLALLENPDGEPMNVQFIPSEHADDPLQVWLLARNQYVRHVESQIMFLWMIANLPDAGKEANPQDSGE